MSSLKNRKMDLAIPVFAIWVVALAVVVAALILARDPSPALGATAPGKVQIVNSRGIPVKIINGGLSGVSQPPGPPFQIQQAVQSAAAGKSGVALTGRSQLPSRSTSPASR
jgi:hypothetical protein